MSRSCRRVLGQIALTPGSLPRYNNERCKIIYVFGFCTPTQWANNEKYGWDDEDSYAFFIDAPTKEDALEWGRHLSELFVSGLFERAGWGGPVPSWRESHFAHWIEPWPLNRFSGLALETLPRVRYGEVPDFEEWIAEAGLGKIRR